MKGLADKLALVVRASQCIIGFVAFLFAWMGFNTFIPMTGAFDPYPYILLNLALSTLASIQAPIIVMSQNRQTERDRISQSNAFAVSLKSDLAIQHLHEKVDQMMKGNNQTGNSEPS